MRLRDGRALAYDRLLLATGPRAYAGGARRDVPGVHSLRTIADVDGITASLVPGARIVLVGAGYIGLEVAAVAPQHGFACHRAGSRRSISWHARSARKSPLSTRRCTAPPASVIPLRAAVKALLGAARVTTVETTDGSIVPCDVAIVGIGIVPNIELAQPQGFECSTASSSTSSRARADPHGSSAG